MTWRAMPGSVRRRCRYGINPFRYRQMHRQTLIVKAPRSSVEQVLWPEFQELSAALTTYLADITERPIREEVRSETVDAEERDEPKGPVMTSVVLGTL